MINTRNQQAQYGFTLLEMLVATGVIGMIVVVLVQVFFATSKGSARVEVQNEVKQTGSYALSVMDRMIRNARTVTSSCAGVDSQTLTIQNPDGNESTFSCATVNGVTRIASDSGANATEYLTSSQVTLGNCNTFIINCISSSGIPPSIHISFTLSQANSSAGIFERASAAFQTSVSLRN